MQTKLGRPTERPKPLFQRLRRHTFLMLAGSQHQLEATYRNEQVRDPPLILSPSFSISFATTFNVPQGTMDYHDSEEARVEPGKWRVKASNKAPGESEEPVTAIMDFTCHSIYTSSALIRNTGKSKTYTTHCTGWNLLFLS